MENKTQEITSSEPNTESSTLSNKNPTNKFLIIGMIFASLIFFIAMISVFIFIKQINTKAHTKKIVDNSFPSPALNKDISEPTPDLNTQLLMIDEFVMVGGYKNYEPDWQKEMSPDKPMYVSYCNKATSIPLAILKHKNIYYLDLGDNNLTTVPNEIKNITDLKELNLAENNFSVTEQKRIKALLPQVKVFFSPQKNFNPNLNDSWKLYENKTYNYSFKYHPELQLSDTKNKVTLKNDSVNFKYAYYSCSTDTSNMYLVISVEDNPKDETPIQYLNKRGKYNLVEEGDRYVPTNKEEAMMAMLGSVKKYKNGDIDGIWVEQGEHDTKTIIASHSHKMYFINLYALGETGSTVSDTAKQILDQILSTFEYTN